jgi:hypothetical protein
MAAGVTRAPVEKDTAVFEAASTVWTVAVELEGSAGPSAQAGIVMRTKKDVRSAEIRFTGFGMLS